MFIVSGSMQIVGEGCLSFSLIMDFSRIYLAGLTVIIHYLLSSKGFMHEICAGQFASRAHVKCMLLTPECLGGIFTKMMHITGRKPAKMVYSVTLGDFPYSVVTGTTLQ